MNDSIPQFSRRQFLQTTGALGVGALLFRSPLLAADEAPPKVAKKKFGKTGIGVSHVGAGLMFDTRNAEVILRTAHNHGVTYWDTAAAYERMGSETGIGTFFGKHPEVRKDIFLVTKGRGDLAQSLEGSLSRMKTDHVELFFVHGIETISEVDKPEVKAFAEKAKKNGKIKFFGFSSHSNMAACLSGGAKLDWIDGAMITYNYREMHKPEMKAALDACVKAGIGVTAMKTLGGRSGSDTPAQAALLKPITDLGFTPAQAKIKAVMENPQIAVACVQMPNMKFARENIAAALDRKELGSLAHNALRRHAEATCDRYCAGCSYVCGAAVAGAVPVRDVMRHLMYYHNYAELDARTMFSEIPAEVRARLTQVDYSTAERACPHRLPIAQLMREASVLLA
jgi:predicted aldo/keto reductase-like oxidoreductase